jgi:hypothetical protein
LATFSAYTLHTKASQTIEMLICVVIPRSSRVRKVGWASMAFWKPGAQAPGLAAERPEGHNEAEASSMINFNPRHSMPLQQQRNMLPIAK